MSDEHFAGGQRAQRLPWWAIKEMKYKMKQIPHKLQKIKEKEAQDDKAPQEADDLLAQKLGLKT